MGQMNNKYIIVSDKYKDIRSNTFNNYIVFYQHRTSLYTYPEKFSRFLISATFATLKLSVNISWYWFVNNLIFISLQSKIG
jgi:hypothetical protein